MSTRAIYWPFFWFLCLAPMLAGQESEFSPLAVQVIEVIGCGSDPQLPRIGALAVSHSGRVAVSFPFEGAVEIWGADWKRAARIDGLRPGPVGWLGDTLYVGEPGIGVVSFFDDRGQRTREVAVEPISAGPDLRARGPIALVDSDLGVFLLNYSADGVVSGRVASRPLVVRSLNTGDPRTVLDLGIANTVLGVPTGNGGFAYRSQPFGDDPLFAMHPSGRLVAVLERRTDSPAPGYEVRVLDINGDLLFRKAVVTSAAPLEPGEIASALDEILGSLSGVPEATLSAEIEELMFVPTRRRAAEGISLPGDGSVWVRRSDRGNLTSWDKIQMDGGGVQTFELPTGLVPRATLDGDVVATRLENETTCVLLIKQR